MLDDRTHQSLLDDIFFCKTPCLRRILREERSGDHSLVHPAKNLQRTNAVAIPDEHQQFAEIIGSGSSEIKDQPVSDDLNVNVGVII